MQTYNNKTVVITGGNSGIGRATAEKFYTLGANVVIFGRNQQTLNAMSEQYPNMLTVQGNVANVIDLDRLYEQTARQFGDIDFLISSAGVGSKRHINDVDEQFFDEIVNVNYKGAFFTVQRAIPLLKNNSAVILVSSIACLNGFYEHSVYSSTKAAVSMLARNFAADLSDRGIRVNAISPGYVDTPIHDKSRAADPEFEKKRCKNIPLHRIGKAEEIANSILFLATAEYVTGAEFVIDGGFTGVFPKNFKPSPSTTKE